MIDVNADAPGDDNENLNGEWVRFTNGSDASVDLDGWQVADESATHRHLFADRTLAPGASVVSTLTLSLRPAPGAAPTPRTFTFGATLPWRGHDVVHARSSAVDATYLLPRARLAPLLDAR